MGRPPCCDKSNVKRGLWTPEEDAKILAYVATHGIGNWTLVPKKAGLNRCGKSCRLRWTNYLRPDLKHDNFTPEEEELIIRLHEAIGSRWSVIARQLPGRTDNDVKNYWNTKLKKKLQKIGIDPITHKPISKILNDFGNISGINIPPSPNTTTNSATHQAGPFMRKAFKPEPPSSSTTATPTSSCSNNSTIMMANNNNNDHTPQQDNYNGFFSLTPPPSAAAETFLSWDFSASASASSSPLPSAETFLGSPRESFSSSCQQQQQQQVEAQTTQGLMWREFLVSDSTLASSSGFQHEHDEEKAIEEGPSAELVPPPSVAAADFSARSDGDDMVGALCGGGSSSFVESMLDKEREMMQSQFPQLLDRLAFDY
ncbi:unnamed protein product [Linum tenue]|uniref:Uncharacterized protein n=1 Tax=Linum tenue TaxID=586396 RepID=A0AAV0NB14_9ROSI|nr:unnamed protein product [Linum tenue]